MDRCDTAIGVRVITRHGNHALPYWDTQGSGGDRVLPLRMPIQGLLMPFISSCPFNSESLGVSLNISESGASPHRIQGSHPLPSALLGMEPPTLSSSLHPKQTLRSPSIFPAIPGAGNAADSPTCLPAAAWQRLELLGVT